VSGSRLRESIEAAGRGDTNGLYEAVRALPSAPATGDGDGAPIPGESFDDVTVAWVTGRIPDLVYFEALSRASSGRPRGDNPA
jgi:hypothetical protein